MAATRPDSDPADEETSSTEQSVATSTSHGTSTTDFKTSVTSGTLSLSTTPVISSASTNDSISSTSIAVPVATTSSTSASSTPIAATTSTSSTSIQWSPAITASPLPNTGTGSSDSTPHANDAFSKSAKQITIGTTVIGGVLILALLVYAICRRRNGATFSEIAHSRRHYPSTIMLSPTPREPRLTALPIYYESRYSVRSSMPASVPSFPKSIRRTAPVPPDVAHKFHTQNPYVKNLWKTAHPPSAPRTPVREAHSFLVSETVDIKEPEKAKIATNRLSSNSRTTQYSRSDTAKSGLRLSVTKRPLSEIEANPATPPDTPYSQQRLQDRWSWTNSQAPTTPRMYAPSLRSSISSLPRFSNMKSWVRGQTERIDEERPATGSAQELKKPILKNKASPPKLAPPPIKRRLSKSKPEHGRIGSLSSIFRQQPGKKAPPPASPRLEEQRPATAPAIEMRQRSQ